MVLKKRNRLLTKKDFSIVLREGAVLRGPFLLIRYRKNTLSVFRFGFIITLRVAGNVVVRNRIKRVLSEVLRQYLEETEGGLDLVVIVNKKDKEELLIKDLTSLIGRPIGIKAAK
jgi:ribonuclease P protein component